MVTHFLGVFIIFGKIAVLERFKTIPFGFYYDTEVCQVSL